MSRKLKPYEFYYKKQQVKEQRSLKFVENLLILVSLSVYGLLLSPFFKDQTLAGHDAGAHLPYLRIFTDALYQGQFPVRWTEWIFRGQNQPLFNFYQPLLYYLAQIPHLLGNNILNSLYLTVLFLCLFQGQI